jgi:hypothetical protein|tara:strand:- start:276 stop:452 length:177 start_codon:yes stop_codon:yes gene_type:complete
MIDMDQPSFDVISEYERYNHNRPKVMQFSDESDSNTNDDESEVNENIEEGVEEISEEE